MYYLFVFQSLTRAQQGARVLNAAGIRAAVIKSPGGAVQEGCTHGVRVPADRVERARRELAASGRTARKLFLVRPNGAVQEVGL